MQLNDREIRVLGAIVEKAMTTPEYYPLTLNSLQAACNQASNRDPVVDYSTDDVHATLAGLRNAGLVREVHRPGQRAEKYRHVLDEVLQADGEQLSLLAVLFLRGAQTVGELRQRTQRYQDFADLEAVESVLEGMATRDLPLVERLPRRPGEKEPRWRHLLTGDAPAMSASDETPAEPTAIPARVPVPDRLASLESEVAHLKRVVADLRRRIDDLGGPEPG